MSFIIGIGGEGNKSRQYLLQALKNKYEGEKIMQEQVPNTPLEAAPQISQVVYDEAAKLMPDYYAPCFKCHEPVKLHTATGLNPKRYSVHCTNKKCGLKTMYRFDTADTARIIWNRIVEKEMKERAKSI